LAPLEPAHKGCGEIRENHSWNLPNTLTVTRIALAPVIALLLAREDRFRDSVAALALCAAALTDFMDGYIARKQGKETRMGQFLDPLADKICISSAFLMLSRKKRLPHWVPGVIIGREALITLFRLYTGIKGAVVPASIWGKLKTNSQLAALLLIIMDDRENTHENMKKASLAIALALTVYSGFDYLAKANIYLKTSEDDG
jgi:CDP-diacylglycerol--glycerol-3-phosphate 3-phosphatidyltransferase